MRGFCELSGKKALVTGGAKRLGRAVCEALARQGVHVIVHYRDSEEAAISLTSTLQALGVGAWAIHGDLAHPEAAPEILARAIAKAGPIDFLINNASIFPEQTFSEMTPAEIHENMDVNALSPTLLARAFAAQGLGGAIVNFLDTRAFDHDPHHVPYHLSKRLFYSLTRMMAVEFAPRIRVNAVAPGLVLPPEGKTIEHLERLRETNPLRDYGAPECVADAVLFLLRSDFMTGQTLFVDGGRHLYASLY